MFSSYITVKVTRLRNHTSTKHRHHCKSDKMKITHQQNIGKTGIKCWKMYGYVYIMVMGDYKNDTKIKTQQKMTHDSME